jgi:aerobic-type carbon monoxide dehydrogenase small subunit (CoxS/CutS family)
LFDVDTDRLSLISLKKSMELNINNKTYTVDAGDDESLLTVLRNHLDLTGSKYGCGEGACGACTVLIDGKATRSCVTEAKQSVGKKITTIEGLEKDGKLHPVQTAFLNADVFQCAYCAPGMVMSAVSLLQKNMSPTEQEIIQSMQGNICRCGIYPRIIKAIQEVSTV